MTAATPASDWRRNRLGDLASVTRGASPRPIASPRWFSDSSDVGWVRIADLGRSDGLTLRTTTQRLSADGIARSRFLPPGTLIMSIAATVGVPIVTGFPACIHDGFVAIQSLRGVDQTYLLYVLKSLQEEMRSAGQTGSQANVNTGIVNGLQLLTPPLEEQKAIAAALHDVDEMIDALQRLVGKQQAIKQGMMQQLLTGKIRLPGFTEIWQESCSIRETCERFSGYWGVDNVTAYADTVAHVIRAGDISANGKLVKWATRYFGTDEWKKAACRTDDVVVTASGNGLGKIYYVHDAARLRLAASNFVRILRPRTGVSGEFIAYVMRSNNARKVLDRHTATSAYPNLLPSFFSDPWFALPSLDEQVAIAHVLHDSDVEIDAIRGRLAKAQYIKQGMMHELLTGRTRLPIADGTE